MSVDVPAEESALQSGRDTVEWGQLEHFEVEPEPQEQQRQQERLEPWRLLQGAQTALVVQELQPQELVQLEQAPEQS